jgi:hypothetical protein
LASTELLLTGVLLHVPGAPKSRLTLPSVVLGICGVAQDRDQPHLDRGVWSDGILAEAASEHKFVRLHLEAGGCHGCPAMAAKTYGDPAAIQLLKWHYVLVKGDEASRTVFLESLGGRRSASQPRLRRSGAGNRQAPGFFLLSMKCRSCRKLSPIV